MLVEPVMALKSTIEIYSKKMDTQDLEINQRTKLFLDSDTCLTFLDTGVYTDDSSFILLFLLASVRDIRFFFIWLYHDNSSVRTF